MATIAGYGNLEDGRGNDNRAYTDNFGDISGASPMIVDAAIILQGMLVQQPSQEIDVNWT